MDLEPTITCRTEVRIVGLGIYASRVAGGAQLIINETGDVTPVDKNHPLLPILDDLHTYSPGLRSNDLRLQRCAAARSQDHTL